MGMISNIEWCDATWNPVNGCEPVSPGCANCYASALSVRWGKGKYGVTRERTLASKGTLRLPYKLHRKQWTRPPRLFTASLSDVFDLAWPIAGHVALFEAIAECTNVNFILVTKRPQLWRDVALRVATYFETPTSLAAINGIRAGRLASAWLAGKVPDNVCVLASVEDQSYALRRIPDLLRIPARWHGLSLEPLLGPVLLDGILLEWLAPFHEHDAMLNRTPRLDWLVIGGESGPKARPCNIDWIRSLASQGKEAGVAVFVKQLGSAPYKYGGSVMEPFFRDFIKLKHKKGGDPSEWPADLRVREWPEGL